MTFGTLLAASVLTLHLIPSPKGIHWTKPQALAISAIRNEIARSPAGKRHPIGHVSVELSCGDQHLYTAMTSQNDSEERRALLHGYGLGVLFKDYAGRLETSKEVSADLKAMNRVGRSSFVRFFISDATCARLMTYLREYHANGYDRIYAGLNGRPLRRQGSGCSAFGASFVELAGLMTPEFETQWMQTRIAPKRFVGGPLTHRRVSVLKILFAFRAPWATDPEQGFLLHFWDPEKMDHWARQAYRDLRAARAQGASHPARAFPWPAVAVSLGKSPGVAFDATHVPTPDGPIFQDAFDD